MKIILATEHHRQRAIDAIRALPLIPTQSVEVKPHKSTRSTAQNSLYWKWLDIIRLHVADSTGETYSAEELHEWFKKKFLPARMVEIAGEVVPVTRTTTKLDTAKMAEYMEKVDRYCVTALHLFLPQPGGPEE